VSARRKKSGTRRLLVIAPQAATNGLAVIATLSNERPTRGKWLDLPPAAGRKQRDIAEWLRATANPHLAAEALRGNEPIEAELREAIADFLEGKIKIKLRPGPPGFFANPREELKRMTREGIDSMVANGMKRDDAIAAAARTVGVSVPTYRRMMGHKGRR